ncbi:hypothetical protein H4Q26_015305 [Puccinia striiformis f. sp. tritici PST-130]|nr:hypothetical protein H4Q26_015305 [Puccinia striiformis f. sp. tritici PST-130]
MFSTVYMTCLLASAALASPVALAPRGFYSSYNNNGRTTDMGHTDATTVTPWAVTPLRLTTTRIQDSKTLVPHTESTPPLNGPAKLTVSTPVK